MKKGTKIAVGIIGGIVIGIVTVGAALFVFLMIFFFGGPPKVTKGAEKYEETIRKYTTLERGRVRTGFFVFPETIPTSAFDQEQQPEFYFSYQDTFDDPTCEVYLKCVYSDADYEAEINRIKNEHKAFGGKTKEVHYDDTARFNYPVYLAIDHHDFSYEYAMDLGNNSIAYIYTAYKEELKSIKKIPKEYLPTDFEESLDFENGSYWAGGNYDIYELPNSMPELHNGGRDFGRN